MEIGFINKTVNTYTETVHLSKRIQETIECVVPDVNDDIGRIVSTQTEVMLKGKERTARGLCICGEINASVIYITENESKVSYVNTSKAFEINYELSEPVDEMLSHAKLTMNNCQARAINPRKLSISFDIVGELYCYTETLTEVETAIADEQMRSVHLRYEEAELLGISAVCEKSFALSEQLIFPAGKASPDQIICKKVEFSISDTQFIGSKAIIKGAVAISVKCSSNEQCSPVCTEFSLPFSQIIDTGKEQLESCSVIIQPTSSYYRLIDTINGEKAIDSEIHAVIQLVCRSRHKLSYISDAYSNLMPAICGVNTREFVELSEIQRYRLSAEEHVRIADDCQDVLNIFTSICQCNVVKGKISAVIQLDIIYRNTGGSLSSVKRSIETEAECLLNEPRIESVLISDNNLRADGALVECRLCIELLCREHRKIMINALSSLELKEEEAYDYASFPSISLVRVEGESMWQLAKTYHSSVENIGRMNDCTEPMKGKLLLIAKTE